MIVNNENGLLGDFIGTIPAMIDYAKANGGLKVIVRWEKMLRTVFPLIPKKYNIEAIESDKWDASFNCMDAWNYAAGHGWLHMNQACYHSLGMPVPGNVPRPELDLRPSLEEWDVDYILVPFARSLPVEQRWPGERWQMLVNMLPEKKFVLTGVTGIDDPNYVTGPNVRTVFDLGGDRDLSTVCHMFKQARDGVISVATGLSHLCYALGVKNYLFINQGPWGKNPEAYYIDSQVSGTSVIEVLRVLGQKTRLESAARKLVNSGWTRAKQRRKDYTDSVLKRAGLCQ